MDQVKKEKLLFYYELFMAFLALVVVGILIAEYTRPLTAEQIRILDRIDLAVVLIFAVDYFYRFARAKDKGVFFKSNIFDLIAIMPFDKAFRIARLARLARVFRLWRLSRLFAFGHRFAGTFTSVLKTNGLIYVIIVTFVVILIGGVGIYNLEENMETFEDALWWSLVTTTTVGYGDISPESTGGRILAGFLMFIGIGFLGMVTGSIATFFVSKLSRAEEAEDTSFTKEQIEHIKDQIDKIETLTEEEFERLWQILKSIRDTKTK